MAKIKVSLLCTSTMMLAVGTVVSVPTAAAAQLISTASQDGTPPTASRDSPQVAASHDGAPTQASAVAVTNASVQDASSVASTQNTDGDIIVTAQRREQRLHDVPVAITVLSNEQLRRSQVNTVSDLSRVAPSVEFVGSPGNPDQHPQVRGLTTNGFSITAEQAVSTVLDGVVLGRAPLAGLRDVARVEVLRGPQGTLFGKNASAGVVNITTNAPELDHFEAIGHADLGTRFDYRSLTGVVNIPVASTVALRVSAGETSYGGLIRNVLTGKDDSFRTWGARARLLWEPSDAVSINLIADYDYLKATDQSFLTFRTYNAPGTPLPGCTQIIPSKSNFQTCNGDPTQNAQRNYGGSGQIDWDLGPAVLTSITSYREFKNRQGTDADGLPGDFFHNNSDYDNNVTTQEVRLASPAGSAVEWVTGIFYSYSDILNSYRQNGSVVGNTPFVSQSGATQQTGALFGQGTFKATDKLKLIAGGRFTRDLYTLFSQSQQPFGARQNGDDKRSNFSWRLGTQYDFDRTFMVYGTVSRGYKGTQINFINITSATDPRGPVGATITNVVSPEFPTAFEIGTKKSLFGGRMDINASVFHTRVKNYQGQVYDLLANNGQGGLINGNIPYVVSRGVELDVFGRLTRDWTVNFGSIYNEARNPKNYVTNCITDPGAYDCPNDPQTGLIDISRRQLPNVPKFKFTLSTNYDPVLGNGLRGVLGADAAFRTSINFTNQPNPFTTTPSSLLLNLRIGVRAENNRWGVQAFVRNATNYRIPSSLTSAFLFANASLPGQVTSGQAYGIDARRVIGLTLDGRF